MARGLAPFSDAQVHAQNLSIMFIAHAPSGYILAVSLLKRWQASAASIRATVVAGVGGAVAPDLDFLYFFLVDHRQTHHHKYLTHWPLSWLLLTVFTAIWLRTARSSKTALPAFIFCLGGMLHMVLDSVVGDIWWFAPFVDRPYSVFTVDAVLKPWWLNFILNGSFVLEVVICTWAVLLYRRRLAQA